MSNFKINFGAFIHKIKKCLYSYCFSYGEKNIVKMLGYTKKLKLPLKTKDLHMNIHSRKGSVLCRMTDHGHLSSDKFTTAFKYCIYVYDYYLIHFRNKLSRQAIDVF